MARPSLPQELAPLADAQLGLLTRAQLASAGISAAAVRHRCLRSWRLVLPDVVSLSSAPLRPEQRLVGAQLLCGPSAQVSSSTAARWYGLENAVDDGRVHVQVPANQAARRAGFVVATRTRRLGPGTTCAGIVNVALLPRAVADTARAARSDRIAAAVVIEAVQRTLVRLDELDNELNAGARRGSARLRSAIAHARTGAWSVAEVDLLDLLGTSRTLPVGWPNPELRAEDGTVLPSPDVWFDDVGLAVQVHSARFYAGGRDWDRTVRLDSIFTEYGIGRLAVTPHEIGTNGRAVRERVERAYLARVGLPRPTVTMTPRGAGRA